MERRLSYRVSQDTLVILINEAMRNGQPARQAAAKLVLSCLRRAGTKAELVACLEQAEREAIFLDIAEDVRRLSAALGLLD